MNWTSLLRFRKQVEEMAKEEVILMQWEKSHQESALESLQVEMHRTAYELERNLRAGVGKVYTEQRYQWLEQIGAQIESKSQELEGLDRNLAALRKKLQKAHHARRVVEIVMARKEAALMQDLAKREQRLMEEAVANQYVTCDREAMVQESA